MNVEGGIDDYGGDKDENGMNPHNHEGNNQSSTMAGGPEDADHTKNNINNK